MDKLKALKANYQAVVAEMTAMLDGADDALDAEQQTAFDGLKAKAASMKTQIANHEQLAVENAEAARLTAAPNAALARQVDADMVILDDPTGQQATAIAERSKIPAKAKRWAGRIRSFKGPDADIQAYKAGMFFAATLCGNRFAAQYCADHGIGTRLTQIPADQIQSLHQEGVNTQGGYLVFDEMERAIIRLVEEFGLARRKMKNVPMISDTKIQPRRTGGLTAYFVGEGAQATESTGSWDQVKLVAKKLVAITVASNEIVSDAIIAIADELIREIALAFSTKEDVAGFQGDGTSTYAGIEGIVPKLSRLNGVDDGGGLILAAGNLWSEFTDANMTKAIGQVPNFPGLMPEWTCSKPFWAQVMVRLNRATGGATMAEFAGVPRQQYAGYPVNWTSGTAAMPVADANSQIACLFGDLTMSSSFGDRAGIMIATTNVGTVGDASMFDTDSFAIRGIERFDINNHDLGTASAAGPVVGIISAAS